MWIIRFSLFSLFIFFLIPAQGHQFDSVRTQEKTFKFGIEFEEPFLELEDVFSEETQEWLISQEEKKWKLLGKNSKNKIKHILYNPQYKNKSEFETFELRLHTFEKKSPLLKIRKDIDELFVPLIDAADFRNSENDYPSIEDYWASLDENFLVVALRHSGSDWLDYLVVDLAERSYLYKLEGVAISWIVFKEQGFIYESFESEENLSSDKLVGQKISYHKFFNEQEDDKVLFRSSDKDGTRLFQIVSSSSESSRLVVSHPFKSDGSWKYALSVIDINENIMIPRPFLIYESDYVVSFDFVRIDEDFIYLRTNLDAFNYSILKFDMSRLNEFETFHNEYEQVLTDVEYLGSDYFGMTYLDKGKYIGLVLKDGKKELFEPPVGASISFSRYGKGFARVDIHKHYEPQDQFKLELSTMKNTRLTSSDYREDDVISEIVNYVNSDGEEMPMILLYSESSKTPRPTFVNVYGGYGTILEPRFEFEKKFMLRNGAMLAYPVIRGGGELGLRVELEGKGRLKKKSISDLIYACEFLVDSGYSSSSSLFTEGASHGGFVVTAAAIKRPDLFKGVFVLSGALDLVREEKFGTRLMDLNMIEFGDPSDSLDFHSIIDTSPIHNLKKDVMYPSFFLMTGLNDTRVPASNSIRFKALLDKYSTNEFNVIHTTFGGHNIVDFPRQELELLGMKFQFINELIGEKLWK